MPRDYGWRVLISAPVDAKRENGDDQPATFHFAPEMMHSEESTYTFVATIHHNKADGTREMWTLAVERGEPKLVKVER